MSFPCIVAFPSPCGDYGSYLWSYLYRTIRRPHEESVPLRGLWFLSKYMTINWPQSRRRIRPLAGIMVLIGIVLLAFSKSKLGTNPSPCGDYGSYLVVDDTKGLITSSESVPLRGLWFLSADQQARFAFDQDGIRPLAGIMVLIVVKAIKHSGLYNVESVPLRGLWFLSIYAVNISTPTLFESVPLRGLWFLSAPFIDGFMKPLKWHFAGRIIYFHHFSSFARK